MNRINLRNPYATLPSFSAIELHPHIMAGMIPNRKAIDRCPDSPARPSPNVRMDLSADDQYREIACVSGNDRWAALVCAVTDEGESEDYYEGEKTAYCCECVGFDAVEAECPVG